MNKVKTIFTVKDLENLSGIKAHTIRIWEKRYQIFTPQRTENNIRLYENEDLTNLLNVSFLNNFGYKISKIAKLNETERQELVKSIYSEKSKRDLAINDFKIAMLNFDAQLFHKVYDQVCKEKSFKDVFYNIFIPLLDEIGMLWQTGTIKPSHEHFISYLIKQKLNSIIENLQLNTPITSDKIYILFLPQTEVHDLGLMFINAELINNGHQTVFLGDNIPLSDLVDFTNHFDDITFVSYFTVAPTADELNGYLSEFHSRILENSSNELWVLGKQMQYASVIPNQIRKFEGIESLLAEI
ncbi:MAG: MerR family transcriptional regulator [Flavobacterium sp.]|nr:MerR family transcriptional regulator [Flavobacterium sp.]